VSTIPTNEEAACLGSAIIGAVSEKLFCNHEETISTSISIKKQFLPQDFDVHNSTLPIFGKR